jgi:OHCU decarboxylase
MNDVNWLNELSPEQAEAEFLKCCGSTAWAKRMTAQRPFSSVAAILSEADAVWSTLGVDDWLEAFRCHPRIGEKKAEQDQSAAAKAWSEQEQSGTRDSAQGVMETLAEGNREYADKFGFIFIVCATGKSADEMLAILEERLQNEREDELRIAAEEQSKITQLRLAKLLGE